MIFVFSGVNLLMSGLGAFTLGILFLVEGLVVCCDFYLLSLNSELFFLLFLIGFPLYLCLVFYSFLL